MASTQYSFGKLTRWSFSLGVSGMFASAFGARAKVTSSNNMNMFVPDPPSPALTFVTADFHPKLYDETTFSPTRAERWRVMIGAAITPNAGIVLGGGYELIRGLSFEGGGALLLGNVLPPGAKFSDPATGKALHTRIGFFGKLFVGLGYSFQ
ncbi:MAG TPA: hypothetical protein VHQ90_02265 [Thermoanaerobaculia bacterium]|nr:hypothetical protein [Thermoanaerobaculia bacterium]